MKLDINRFCWHGCVSTDIEASLAFYKNVIGWTTDKPPVTDQDEICFVTHTPVICEEASAEAFASAFY